MSYTKQRLEEKPMIAAAVGFGYQSGRRKSASTTIVTEEHTKTSIKDTKVSVSITKTQ